MSDIYKESEFFAEVQRRQKELHEPPGRAVIGAVKSRPDLYAQYKQALSATAPTGGGEMDELREENAKLNRRLEALETAIHKG